MSYPIGQPTIDVYSNVPAYDVGVEVVAPISIIWSRLEIHAMNLTDVLRVAFAPGEIAAGRYVTVSYTVPLIIDGPGAVNTVYLFSGTSVTTADARVVAFR